MPHITEDSRRWIGWGISILFHVSLLVLGTAWLIQPARFHVEPGKTSTEIEFAVEPVATPEVSPPQPSTPPVPTPQPITPPVPEQVPVAVVPEPIAIPPPPSASIPSQAPAKPITKPKSLVHKEATSASKGAVQASPDALHNEPPEYPEESQAAHEEGVVTLKVEVTAEGKPTAVNIAKSSGYFRLDQAARKAVQHWKFSPAITAGIPVTSEAEVPVRFKLQ